MVRNKLGRWLREGLLTLLLIGLVIKGVDWFRAPVAPAHFASKTLTTVDGETVSLAALSAERPLLVYFWASWCAVCRFTTPTAGKLAQNGHNVLAVAIRSGDDARVARYLQAKQVSFPLVNDAEGRLASDWQIGVTPTWVIIDKGKVVSTTTGWSSYYGMKLRLWL